MEKIDYLCFESRSSDSRGALTGGVADLVAGTVGLTLYVGDTDDELPSPPLLLGRGSELAAVVSVWLDCLDDRLAIDRALEDVFGRVHAYLVTESEPQKRAAPRDWPDGTQSPGITHFTWFPKPERLTAEEFFHGWHDVHTPHSAALHPLRSRYVRDSVARGLSAGAPRVDAIVFEHFDAVADYGDPKRLFGSREAFEQNMVDLPGYADLDDINCRPLYEVVIAGHS